MGYARVFWIREEPIRQYIAANGQNEAVSVEVGRRILSFSAKDSHGGKGKSDGDLPLFDTPSVFFPFRSFHSNDFCILIWTGSRLCTLPEASPAVFESLLELTSTIGTRHVVLRISKAEYQRAVGGLPWRNQLEQSMNASLYYIYEDFTRVFERHPEIDWPSEEVGAATLNLMFSDWSKSKHIRNHGDAITRCCSFAQPEFAVLVWSRNCLRLISEIDSDEIQRIREYLAREQKVVFG